LSGFRLFPAKLTLFFKAANTNLPSGKARDNCGQIVQIDGLGNVGLEAREHCFACVVAVGEAG